MTKYRVLVVDDDEAVGNSLKDAMELLDIYSVTVARSGEEGLACALRESFHAYLVDQIMPGMSGTEFIRTLIEKYPEPLVYVITAEDDGVALREAEKGDGNGGLPIRRYVPKPWPQSLFSVDLREDLRERDLKRDLLNAVEIHVNQQRDIQEQLSVALDALRAAERFQASMSGALMVVRGAEHEINNLNAGLHGYSARLGGLAARAASLSGTELSKELGNLHPRVQAIAERLKLYTDFIASLGRAPSEPPRNVLVKGLVDQVMEDVRETASADGLSLTTDVPNDVSLVCMPVQLRNALYEIVRNGVEALGGERGTVGLAFREQSGHGVFTITDSGQGITSEDLENVFVPLFTQRKIYGGKGGPVAHKIIVENHRGSIVIDSCTERMVNAGSCPRGSRGTTVTITLPKAQ